MALQGYAHLAKRRGWPVSDKAKLYIAAEGAFNRHDPQQTRFTEIYEDLRSKWQVFRPTKRYWPPEHAFEVLMSPVCQDCSREHLDLVALNADHLESMWRCLAELSGIKTLKSGGVSAMAVSKFLHFFNPRLFPIFDRAVIQNQAIPPFREALDRSRQRWHEFTLRLKRDTRYERGLGEYLCYLLWAADCFAEVQASRTMEIFASRFDAMLDTEARGARPPEYIHLNYATAFEFALIGATAGRSAGPF